MAFRHEWKHEISAADLLVLRSRLSAVMQSDCHAAGGRYEIRSLYFDDLRDRALREKLDGTDPREKFRLRFYNGDTGFIRLEKKAKRNGLSEKTQAVVCAQEVRMLLSGDLSWMRSCDRELPRELYARMLTEGLRPRAVVDYTREPFVYAPGNVRVTLDYDLRRGLSCADFLDSGCPVLPVDEPPGILEVKWDGFLPDLIRDAVQLPGRHTASFSKYAACRMAGG